MDFSNLKCNICHRVGMFVFNEQSQLICNVCHSLMAVYQEELTDFMPGVAMRGWRASSQNAFEPVNKTVVEPVQVSKPKRINLSDASEISLAVQMLTNILALQAVSLRPYLRNSNGVCSTVKKIFLYCLSDEEWIKKQLVRPGFRMEITLAILSLSSLYHREFLLPCHIAEMATTGEIPYMNVFSKLTVPQKQADSLKKIFETRTFPSASIIQREARALLLDTDHCWPPLRNCVGNFLSSVSGYHDFPCSCSSELAKSMIDYFQLPDQFLDWMFPLSICRRISQEKGLEPCGEIDVLCDLLNLLKISLIYQCIFRKEKASEDNRLAPLESSVSIYELFRNLTKLKEKKTLYYRIFHNDWNGISDEEVHKLSQLYENIIVGTEHVPDAYLSVFAALKDIVSQSSYITNSSACVQLDISQEDFDRQFESDPARIACVILSEFVDLGLRYLGRESTEKLRKYVIQVSDTQLQGILVLMGLVKDKHSEDTIQTLST
ncbi:hypothetical protein GpartN1_g5682.t1 [Galdieria partita]|uniref:Uncharacterized protein n=1 Tax=Galdieria partita TaxID=83374 RepID=A0A9C7Q1P7_9RHOD|nr:hypothetical protein GpartN1_g5682.t1 [Galdieria partita]